jgi:hypothetical protein
MPNRRRLVRIGACLAPIAVLSCSLTNSIFPGRIAATTMPAAAATAAASERQTPDPTVTRRPTASPTPLCVPALGSEAMKVVQSEADVLIPGGAVIWFDDFLCGDLSYGWGTGDSNPTMKITVSDSIVTITARKYGEIWEGLSRAGSTLQDQTGYLVLFRSTGGTTGNLALVTGDWQTPSNRSWMLSIRSESSQWADWEGWEGTEWMNGPFPYSMLRPGAWYYYLIQLEKGGKITAMVWEKDRPENRTEFHRTFGSKWEGLKWSTLFQVYEGTIELDRYWEAAFVDRS